MRKLYMAIFLFLFCNLSFANLPYFPLSFPRDEGAHYQDIPYTYTNLMEWWYYNGKFTTDDGRHFSYDIAFFNPAQMSGGTVTAHQMLHVQLADLDNNKTYGVVSNLPNNGRISTQKLYIIAGNDFLLKATTQNGQNVYALKAAASNGTTSLKFDLTFVPIADKFLINGNGLIPLPNDTNSYYYSIPHLNATGTITVNGEEHKISSPGDSWMDHQWGDFDTNADSWEWLGVRLNNGLVGNIFLTLDASKNVISGLASIISPTGDKQFIAYPGFSVTRDNYWLDPQTGIQYPMTFNVSIPSLGLQLTNVAAFSEQEVNGYWEGYCNVNAVYNGQNVSGYSYTELAYHS